MLQKTVTVFFVLILLLVIIDGIASAETLTSGATVCESKEAMNGVFHAVADGSQTKYYRYIESGQCVVIDGNYPVKVIGASGFEVCKINLRGEVFWCLCSQLR